MGRYISCDKNPGMKIYGLVTILFVLMLATLKVDAKMRPAVSEVFTSRAGFTTPDYAAESPGSVLSRYTHLQIPYPELRPAVAKALQFFNSNKDQFTNQKYISVIDYTLSAKLPRFHIFELSTGRVKSIHTSHGRGSDPEHDGFADRFSDIPESKMTALGFLRTAETYFSAKFQSPALRLDGLSLSNKLARERAIVIHGANYVLPEKGVVGRSLGCPALSQKLAQPVIDRIKGGSLILSWFGDDAN
jgi:L,D-transpeptidase catalytic domain